MFIVVSSQFLQNGGTIQIEITLWWVGGGTKTSSKCLKILDFLVLLPLKSYYAFIKIKIEEAQLFPQEFVEYRIFIINELYFRNKAIQS